MSVLDPEGGTKWSRGQKWRVTGLELVQENAADQWCYHSLQAMRKQQDDAILSNPFGLTWTDELVDDALSCVVKISKLGLPQNQCIWTGHSEA